MEERRSESCQATSFKLASALAVVPRSGSQADQRQIQMPKHMPVYAPYKAPHVVRLS